MFNPHNTLVKWWCTLLQRKRKLRLHKWRIMPKFTKEGQVCQLPGRDQAASQEPLTGRKVWVKERFQTGWCWGLFYITNTKKCQGLAAVVKQSGAVHKPEVTIVSLLWTSWKILYKPHCLIKPHSPTCETVILLKILCSHFIGLLRKLDKSIHLKYLSQCAVARILQRNGTNRMYIM